MDKNPEHKATEREDEAALDPEEYGAGPQPCQSTQHNANQKDKPPHTGFIIFGTVIAFFWLLLLSLASNRSPGAIWTPSMLIGGLLVWPLIIASAIFGIMLLVKALSSPKKKCDNQPLHRDDAGASPMS